jgi:hypothetical protein
MTPGGANVDAIKALYDKAIRSGTIQNPIRYYVDAEVDIAVKYVGLVRKNQVVSRHVKAVVEKETR